MNIFFSDDCPLIAARNLDDLRLNKMISEGIQMLSIAVWCNHPKPSIYSWGPVPKMFSKPTAYRNHPCSKWARKTKENYLWLLEHTEEMVRLRRAKGHFNENSYKLDNCRIVLSNLVFPFCGYFNPPLCSELPEDTSISLVENYRSLLRYKWEKDLKSPKWTFGEKPKWI